jgi:cytidylate kinase
MQGVQILLITGPAGVGKSTVCWEMGAQLAAAQACDRRDRRTRQGIPAA